MIKLKRVLGAIFIVAVIGFGFTACEEEEKEPEVINPCNPDCRNMGSTGPGGGKVFYHDHYGFTVVGTDSFESYTAYYLEAAPTDYQTELEWGYNFKETSLEEFVETREEIGTGRANTEAIVAGNSAHYNFNSAAHAATITINEKTDWFLPSKNELSEMCKAKNHVGIEKGTYWSSSLYYESHYASPLGIDFANNATGSAFISVALYSCSKVRAIRAF